MPTAEPKADAKKDDKAKPIKLSGGSKTVLAILRSRPAGVEGWVLKRDCQMEPGAIWTAVQQLVDLGLARRPPGGLVILTPAGQAHADAK